MRKRSISDERHYNPVRILPNFIDNVKINVEMVIENLPQDYLVIFGTVHLDAQRLFIPWAASSGVAHFSKLLDRVLEQKQRQYFVAVDYSLHEKLATCCNAKEEKVRLAL